MRVSQDFFPFKINRTFLVNIIGKCQNLIGKKKLCKVAPNQGQLHKMKET